MSAHVLAVGELYDPNRTSFPTTEQVRLGRSTAELVRFWSNPSAEEIASHDRGAAHFAMVDESPALLILAYKYGDLDWCDVPYQAHRLTTDNPTWPQGGPAEQIAFRTVLVDADTGVIRSLRYDVWSVEFSNAVRVAVAEQLIHDLDEGDAETRLNAVYAASPTSELMVQTRAVATCSTDGPSMGGDAPFAVHFYG
jgi:hypothetical protein